MGWSNRRPSHLVIARLIVAATLSGCNGRGPSIEPPSMHEVGLVPSPPGTGGRDVGYSVPFAGHSVWVFGGTFFAESATDGYRWRASTWSFTDDADARDGLGGWTHALGADAKPLALLPHTATEQAFNDAHNGDPCPTGTGCGERHTAWPGVVVVDPRLSGALVFYEKEETSPTGAFSFRSVGTSIAIWPSPDAPALRPELRPDLPDPTVLFPEDEPGWGSAAVVDGDFLFAYACEGGNLSVPCLLARVPIEAALNRSAWLFYAGSGWSDDWHAAAPVFDGAPLMSVHRSPYLDRFVAYYMVPLGGDMALRTAAHPEGPWSPEVRFGEAEPALDGNWDYALIAHPELSREDGRVEYVSYFRPGVFLDGTIHLVEVTYR